MALTNVVALLVTLGILAGYGLNISALFFMRRYLESDYLRIGKNRSAQKGLHVFGLVFPGVGTLLGIYWFFVTKRKLESDFIKSAIPKSASALQAANEDVGLLVARATGRIPKPLNTLDNAKLPSQSSIKPEIDFEEVTAQSKILGEEQEPHEDFVLETFDKEFSAEQLTRQLSGKVPNFEFSQAFITGLRLVSDLSKQADLSQIEDFGLVELFRSGYQIGCLGYNLLPVAPNVMDLTSEEQGEYFRAAAEDSEFFLNIQESELQASFLRLPLTVRHWFHSQVEHLATGVPLDVIHPSCLRVFVSGIAYVSFER